MSGCLNFPQDELLVTQHACLSPVAGQDRVDAMNELDYEDSYQHFASIERTAVRLTEEELAATNWIIWGLVGFLP